MADYLARLKMEDVVDVQTLCVYTHQILGTPPTTIKDMSAVKKKVADIFALYPRATFQTLAKTMNYASRRNARPRDVVTALYWLRKAWEGGELPELDPESSRDQALETKLKAALEVETHPRWVEQLKGALWFHGDDVREEVYQAWMTDRKAANLPVPK